VSNLDLIRHLAEFVEPVSRAATGDALYEMFSADPDILSIPVVEDGKPVGLVNRYDFMLRLADRFGRALYERRPVTQVMDAAPLIVDANVMLDELGSVILTRKPGAIMSGFIVTENGRYFGIGTALSMLRMRVQQTENRAELLELARREAEAASRSKTEFLANMSHELRTPLNAIIGFSDILVQQIFGALGHERYLQYARDIHGSGHHLLQIIADILDLSKIEAGKLQIEIADVDPVALIKDAMRMTEASARSCGVAVVLEKVPSVGVVRADPTKLRQILINVLSNAVKFTPRGGRVSIAAMHEGASDLWIVVSDTGIGMTPDEVRIALEPFRQIESHLNKRFAGTGLGLPLTKSLVELHGGTIEIESERGSGTTVTIRLPGVVAERRLSVA
jgi:two-component system cell cycle sensor histidine kinase PleC